MNDDMHISKQGLDFLVSEEGIRLYVYDDGAEGAPMYVAGTPLKGNLTFGIGHLVKQGDPWKIGKTYTKEQAYEQKTKDLAWVEAIIKRYVRVPLNQRMFDALCSLVFNIGPGRAAKGAPGFVPGFTNSTLLLRINARAQEAVIRDAWHSWKYSKGRPILLARRKRETSYAFSKQPLKDPAGH